MQTACVGSTDPHLGPRHLFLVRPWVRPFTSQSFCFLICKLGTWRQQPS